ncbi:MAG: ABC transporter permease [Spirochaetota bacterium]
MRKKGLGKTITSSIVRYKAAFAVFMMLVVMIFPRTNFYSVFNLLDMLNSASILMIVSFGLTLVILSGAIDLSGGGSLVLGGILTVHALSVMPMWLAILVGTLVGAVIGVVNGYIIVYQKTEPVIVTLGTSIILTGIAQQLTDAHPISPPPGSEFMMIGNGRLFGVIPYLVIIMLVVFVLFYILLRYTQFGRNIYAIGGDYEVAEYSGIDVKKIKAATYVLAGMTASFAGVLLSSKLNSASSIYGDQTALVVISGIVVGGTSLAGGVGGVGRSLVGLLVFAVMENAMSMLHVDSYIQQIIRGIVIVSILALDSYGRKRRREDV